MSEKKLPHHHGNGESVNGLLMELEHTENFHSIASVFAQLGDPTRLRIFWLLCHREECVVNIAYILNMSSPAIAHHLRPLRNSGLIVSRRDGREVYYRVADTVEAELLHRMIEQVMMITCPG